MRKELERLGRSRILSRNLDNRGLIGIRYSLFAAGPLAVSYKKA